eukprot:scaffold1373_cov367-Pinguiococcus_pyrenoidosus.AAC.32
MSRQIKTPKAELRHIQWLNKSYNISRMLRVRGKRIKERKGSKMKRRKETNRKKRATLFYDQANKRYVFNTG